ncbi:AAA family ATPase [Algoriphagus boritolerans]|uniref:AAA family ATPase n=1 Tax=Algoriphagus boritolerans TaxID=308111 RepID=UPI003A0FEFFB
MIFLQNISLPTGNSRQFPFSIPAFKDLESLDFRNPITVFVGENGSGKSTLLKL